MAGLAFPAALTMPAFGQEKRQKTVAASGKGEQDEKVTPPEDLMREHGVLDRVLLVYEAGLRKFAANEDFDPAVITQGAEIVRDFIENYHEKSEEDYVFPRFKKAGKMVDLVDTLLAQHPGRAQGYRHDLATCPRERPRRQRAR